MGGATWSADVYASTSATYRSQDRSQLFSKRHMREDFDPKNITLRESCDSEQNPNSTPIIIGLDVTGSMGFIPEALAKEHLGTLVEGIHDTKPVSDPHIMMMAIGDITCDSAPLQVTQFEADIRIAEQLTDLYLEGGGGGNNYESYDLPWLFAARKTKIDSYDKRGVKGYLFTIGDEMPPVVARRDRLNESIGAEVQADMQLSELHDEVSERYNVFHLIMEEGGYFRRRGNDVTEAWGDILGRRALNVNDHTKVAEIIQSAIHVNEGMDVEDAISLWQDQATRDAVAYSLNKNKQ